jgi:phosphate/sulfate permease
MPLFDLNYLLVVGTVFAFLDAWNIGSSSAAHLFHFLLSNTDAFSPMQMC